MPLSAQNVQNISIPLSGMYAGRKSPGCLHGSGRNWLILSNMNTNRQNEWEPLVNTLTSRGYAVLTYDYIDPHNDQSQVLADALSFA